MAKVRVPDNSFGIIDGGIIKIITDQTELTFKRSGQKRIEMHLTLTFEEDVDDNGDGNIAMEGKVINCDSLGAFKFDSPMFKETKRSAIKDLSLSIDIRDENLVRIQSKFGDFDIATKGEKRESGGSLTPEKKTKSKG